MTSLIGSDAVFSEQQLALLKRVAALVIPSDESRGLPAADDEKIFSIVVSHLAKNPQPIIAVLNQFDADELTLSQLESTADPVFRGLVSSAVAQAYYQDARVLEMIGYDPRPPFPEGRQVEQGDWSLLDPVKQRDPFWRKVD